MTTLEQNKQKILKSFLRNCLFDGWNNKNLQNSAKEAGFTASESHLFFENGIYSLTDFFIEEGNKEFEEKAKNIDLKNLRIRDKIKELVKTRLLVEEENKNAIKVLTTISKGRKIPNLLKNSYKIADKMWEITGDTSTDINFYTKRLILSKVFSKTLLFFISDNSKNNEESWKILDKEIEKVMKIGKIKATFQTCTNKFKECNFSKNSLKEKISKLPFIRLY